MTCVQHLVTPQTPTTRCQRSRRSPRGLRGSLRPYCGPGSRFDGGRGRRGWRGWRQGRVGRPGGRRDRTRGSAEGTRTSVAGGFPWKGQRTKRRALCLLFVRESFFSWASVSISLFPAELNPGIPIGVYRGVLFPQEQLPEVHLSTGSAFWQLKRLVDINEAYLQEYISSQPAANSANPTISMPLFRTTALDGKLLAPPLAGEPTTVLGIGSHDRARQPVRRLGGQDRRRKQRWRSAAPRVERSSVGWHLGRSRGHHDVAATTIAPTMC